MSEQDPKKPQPIKVDISYLSSDQIRQLIDLIYAQHPDVEFTPEEQQAFQAGSSQTQTQSRTDTKLTYPKRYNVIFLNDDYTPMDFVIQLLVEIFNKNIEQAQELTMMIHNDGSAVVGTYSREIAEQKTHEAITACHHSGHPLEILCEPM